MEIDLKNIDRLELQETVVQFYFKDGTKTHIKCDPFTGSGAIHYTGNRTKQAHKFISELTNHTKPNTDSFWFDVISLVHDYTIYIYEL